MNKYIVIDSKLQICDKSFQKTPQGYLQLEAIIARSGQQEYLAHELGIFDGDPNKIIVLDRPPQEVTDSMSVASFINMPVTDEHPAEGQVGPENFTKLVRGVVLDAEATPSNQVKAKMIIHDAELIKKIEDGKRELSAGYTAEIEFSDDGKTAVQRKIRGNHVAFVDAARCGKECSIFDNKPKHKGEPTMAKMKIKGVEYEFTDSVAPVVKTLIDENENLETKISDKEKEISKLQATNDALEEKMKKMMETALGEDEKEKEIEDAANERLAVLLAASKVITDYDPTGKSIDEIKRDVVIDALPDVDFTDRDDAYVAARFDILVEDAKSNKGEFNDAFKKMHDGKVTSVEDARQKKIERSKKAYKGGK